MVYETAIKHIKGNAYMCTIAITIAFGAGLSVLFLYIFKYYDFY